jgi:polyisoprenoid-binding protein YceI
LVTAALLSAAAIGHPTIVAAQDAPEWSVDYKLSSISFTGRQMGVPSKGRFKAFSAKIRFDPTNLAGSAVEVTIDTGSADAGNPDIDKELKQPKWFEIERFPSARFVTTAFRAKGNNAYEADGRLTIRDVTQDVVLPFKVDIGDDRAAPDQLVARAAGEITISRSKFGIGREEWRDTKIVGDEVGIRIDIVARRKK